MTNKNQLLDFAIIGAQKCATTWLYDCLEHHPMINMRDSKNEDPYYGGPLYKQKGGDEWYFSQFKNKKPGQKRGCVSVDYIEDMASAQNLLEHNPDIKIILCLRNPAERAVSAYQWYVRKSFIPNLPLNEGIKQVIAHYNETVIDQYSAMYKNIIERGFYYEKIMAFTKCLPAGNIKIVLYDDIKKAPLITLQNIMHFLQIDESYVAGNANTIPKKNTGFAPLIMLERQFPSSRIIRKVVDIGNQVVYKIFKPPVPSAKVDSGLLEELNGIYDTSLQNLSRLLANVNPELNIKLKKYWSL